MSLRITPSGARGEYISNTHVNPSGIVKVKVPCFHTYKHMRSLFVSTESILDFNDYDMDALDRELTLECFAVYCDSVKWEGSLDTIDARGDGSKQNPFRHVWCALNAIQCTLTQQCYQPYYCLFISGEVNYPITADFLMIGNRLGRVLDGARFGLHLIIDGGGMTLDFQDHIRFYRGDFQSGFEYAGSTGQWFFCSNGLYLPDALMMQGFNIKNKGDNTGTMFCPPMIIKDCDIDLEYLYTRRRASDGWYDPDNVINNQICLFWTDINDLLYPYRWLYNSTMKLNCCSDQHNQIKIGLYKSKLVTNADFFPVIVYDSHIEMDLGYMYKYSYGPIVIKSTLSGKIPEIDYTDKWMPEEGIPQSDGFVDFPVMQGALLSTFDYTGSWYVPEIDISNAISCNFNNCTPSANRAKNCNLTISGQFNTTVNFCPNFTESYGINVNINVTCPDININYTVYDTPEGNNETDYDFNIVANCEDIYITYNHNSCGYIKPANITVNVKNGYGVRSVYISGGEKGTLRNAVITVNRPILGLKEVYNYTETIIRAKYNGAWIGSEFTSWHSDYNAANVLQWEQVTVDADGKKAIRTYRNHTGDTVTTTITFDKPYEDPCKEKNQ